MIDHDLRAVLSWALGGLWQVIWKPWVCRSPEFVAQVLVKSLGKVKLCIRSGSVALIRGRIQTSFPSKPWGNVESLLNLFEVEGSGSRGLLRKACLGMIRNLVHRLDQTFCHEGMQQGSMTDWTTMFPARAGQRKLWMSTFQRQVSHGTFCCVQPEFDHLGQHFKCITWI